MNYEQLAICSVLGGALVFFVWGRWRYDLVAFAVLMVSVVLGLIPPDEAFLGFGHPAVITVGAVLIISRTLSSSGFIDVLTSRLASLSNHTPGNHIGILGGLASILSAFMNNVGALAMLMPVAIKTAKQAKRSPSLILMPIAFASILGGLVTLIGTPPNIIIATFRSSISGEPFRMFDFAPVGGPVALVGFLFVVFFGWRLLPKKQRDNSNSSDLFEVAAYMTEFRAKENSPVLGKGRRVVTDSFEKYGAKFIGIIRGENREPVMSWQGRLGIEDILIIEVSGEDIDKLISKLDLDLVGTGSKVTDDLNLGEQTLIEAVVSPGGMIENRTALGVKLRSRFGVNLLALSREGSSSRARLGRARLRAGDVLLLHGSEERMLATLSQIGCLPLAQRGVRINFPERAWASIAIFIAAIIATSTGLISAPISLGLAAVSMLALRSISLKEAYESVNWPVIVLLGSMIPVGGALQTSGTTELIADVILDIGSGLSPVVVLIIVLVVTMTLSDIVNNAATAVIMAPIAMNLAQNLGVNPDAFLMAVAIGASCAFLTPIGHQNNTLVMGPGAYRFLDYWRMGLPLEIIIVAVATPLILVVWPL